MMSKLPVSKNRRSIHLVGGFLIILDTKEMLINTFLPFFKMFMSN